MLPVYTPGPPAAPGFTPTFTVPGFPGDAVPDAAESVNHPAEVVSEYAVALALLTMESGCCAGVLPPCACENTIVDGLALTVEPLWLTVNATGTLRLAPLGSEMVTLVG